MGANVECEELGCVVGGPFKPNKLREVRGLVWRPWINKPSEMTMRCADICHHTALDSKHKPPKSSLPLFPSPRPVSHMVPLPPSIPLLSLSSPLFHPLYFYLYNSFYFFTFLCFICNSTPALPLSLPPYLHSSISSLPSDSIHPSIRSSMHAWLAGRPSGFLYVL